MNPARHVVVGGLVRHLKGWRPQVHDHRDFKLARVAHGGEAPPVPPSASVRGHSPLVEDQGALGSCTAHASTSAMKYLYLRDGKAAPELSRLFVYWQTRVAIEGTSPSDDSGAAIRDVMKAIAMYGAPSEDLWPYITSRFALQPSDDAVADAAKRKALLYYACDTLRMIKVSIEQGFPVVCGFSVPRSMLDDETARTGLVKFPTLEDPIDGGHAILLVGYDDSTRLVCFENSWGESWGDHGYGYLPYEYFGEHDLVDLNSANAGDAWTLRAEAMF